MCYISKKARQVIMVMSISVVLTAILLWFYVSQSSYVLEYNLGKNFITIKPNSRSLTIELVDEKVFELRLGSQVHKLIYAADCHIHTGKMSVCMDWIDDHSHTFSMISARTVIKFEDGGDEGANCLHINWKIYASDFLLEDCINMTIGHWYGGAETNRLKWPLERSTIPMQPYVSLNLIDNPEAYGSVLERYWLSSSGIAINVEKTSPLHVSINETGTEELCLRSSYTNSPYKNPLGLLPHLNYSVCMSRNVRKVHDLIANENFEKPSSVPDQQMFESPIWSTSHKQNITQELVLSYAKEIQAHKFPNSHIEINYDTRFGGFDSEKFPNPRGMVQKLHNLGFRVISQCHPFANFDSYSFKEGLENGYWIRDSKNSVPGLVKWSNDVAAIIDPTNVNASSWFIDRLKRLQETTGIDSFKFDAGETQYLPLYFNSDETLNDPNLYCSRYVNMVTEMGSVVSVRCGHQSQNQSVFVRIMEKNSNWDYENGLKTLIPSAILFGLLGYPFVLPDAIGGNAYVDGNINAVYKPERELYIRWMQVTAYLPAMQFSVAPWQYDDEVVSISRKMVNVHKNKVAPLVLQLAKETINTGHPIIRPLWWIAPKDTFCQQLDSEFLIGDSFLVAPILDYGARKRDVYLPSGVWRDTSTGKLYTGGKWIQGFSVPLDHVATFEKINED